MNGKKVNSELLFMLNVENLVYCESELCANERGEIANLICTVEL